MRHTNCTGRRFSDVKINNFVCDFSMSLLLLLFALFRLLFLSECLTLIGSVWFSFSIAVRWLLKITKYVVPTHLQSLNWSQLSAINIIVVAGFFYFSLVTLASESLLHGIIKRSDKQMSKNKNKIKWKYHN